jgi:D-alanyl-D-alanine carboxypeptidase (penicillin-binding protein 5/6)
MLCLSLSVDVRSVTAEGEPPPPAVYANNAVVLSDYNEVLLDINARKRAPMASTTKMMTAIVAVRYGNLDMPVLIDESDIVGESSMGLVAGDTVTLHGLLYGLLMPSGNDAAHAIARALGWRSDTKTAEEAVQNFVDMMNQTAQEYQLRDTHYMNPHGLDQDGHYSTPYDLAIILRAALNYPVIREVMQTRAIHVDGYDVWNGNKLYGMREDVIGGKTGFTDFAGFCLAAAAQRDGRFAIAVVTGDDGEDWYTDVSNLLDWGLTVEVLRGPPSWVSPTATGTQLSQQPGPKMVSAP